MASSSGRVKLKSNLTLCSSKAVDRVRAVFKSEKKMSEEEFIAFFRFEITMDNLLELQTTISSALSFMVSVFGEDEALDIIRDSSENCLLTRLVQGHIVCEFDFPVGDYTTKVRDAKKVYDDFFGEARKLILDVHKKYDINLVQKLRITQPGSSVLDQRLLRVERFMKECKDFEVAWESAKAIEVTSYSPDVITLGQLYVEWVGNEEQHKFALPQP